MLSLLGFLAILGPLVIVHELGHFFFAKLFGVRADAFSVGFGPKLWSKKIGETEFRLSAVPLGGYVKLFGEEPGVELQPGEEKRALQRAAPWKRFWIFAGGPLFNFIFAIFIFMVILAIGEPQPASVIARVIPGTQAEQSGFESGDRVLSVNGTPVRRLTEFLEVVSDHPDAKITAEVQRRTGDSATLEFIPSGTDGFSIYGEQKTVGKLDGLGFIPRNTVLGVSRSGTVAGQAGLRTGDVIVSFMSSQVRTWEDVEAAYRRVPNGGSFSMEIRPEVGDVKLVTLQKPVSSKGLDSDLGIHSVELFIHEVVQGSPAERAGILKGDRIFEVNGKTVASFPQLREAVQNAGETGGGKASIAWERDGKILRVTSELTGKGERDHNLNKIKQYTIGVVPYVSWTDPETVSDPIYNPFVLFYKGTEKMVTFVYMNVVSIGKMFTGDVSVSTLGGPILIGKIAGQSMSRGLVAFLTTMAVLSVGLGILNILPIPVLDGGHILLLGIEVLRGKALSIRQMEIFQQVGLSLILLLMVVVMKNDISRLSFFN